MVGTGNDKQFAQSGKGEEHTRPLPVNFAGRVNKQTSEWSHKEKTDTSGINTMQISMVLCRRLFLAHHTRLNTTCKRNLLNRCHRLRRHTSTRTPAPPDS